MDRRRFVLTTLAGALATPLAAGARLALGRSRARAAGLAPGRPHGGGRRCPVLTSHGGWEQVLCSSAPRLSSETLIGVSSPGTAREAIQSASREVERAARDGGPAHSRRLPMLDEFLKVVEAIERFWLEIVKLSP